jgi:Na+/phosphate symporter
MVISPLALLMAIIGLVMYLTIPHAKWAEVGRIFLFSGMVALLIAAGQKSVTLF